MAQDSETRSQMRSYVGPRRRRKRPAVKGKARGSGGAPLRTVAPTQRYRAVLRPSFTFPPPYLRKGADYIWSPTCPRNGRRDDPVKAPLLTRTEVVPAVETDDRWRIQYMAESGIGFERSIDATGYSPLASGAGDHGFADRPQWPGTSGVGRDGSPQDLATLIKLGTLKMDAGNEAEATQFFRKALELGDRSLGPDHPDLILLLNDLTRLYLKQSAHAAAEPLLLRLLDMKRSKGEDHPEVATVLASLATVRQALGRHESAEQLWRRVVDIRERTLAPNHFAIATALEHLGGACAARGKIGEALRAFQRALSIRELTLGAEHPSLRVSRERIDDLQLQAEDSLDPGGAPEASITPERYRLQSGEAP